MASAGPAKLSALAAELSWNEAAIFAVFCLHRRLYCFQYIGLAFCVAGIFFVGRALGVGVQGCVIVRVQWIARLRPG